MGEKVLTGKKLPMYMKKLISKRKYENKTRFVLSEIHFADANI